MMHSTDRAVRLMLLLPAALLVSCQSPEAPSALPEGPVRIEPGRPFPDLALPSLEDGSPIWLRQFRGRKLLLHVFATW